MVAEWSADEGWGVIASADTPGGCWAHFSHLEMPGYRSLDPGEVVQFEWEQPGQDGYGYRAVRVRPARAHPGTRTDHRSRPAYRGSSTVAPAPIPSDDD
jgi:CspA family cold shock protein